MKNKKFNVSAIVFYSGIIVLALVLPNMAFSGTIQLPQTGQTTCWDTNGSVIPCAGTGQDGDIQAGVAWPSPRFTANGDGTVTDKLTGLMWTQNSNPAPMVWVDALNYVKTLNIGGYTDWRLPNINELHSIIDASQHNPALPLGHPFGVPSSYYGPYVYWSSTTFASYTNCAWVVNMEGSIISVASYKGGNYYAWPVRGGGSLGTSSTTMAPSTTTTIVCDAACWQALYEQSQAQLQQCQADLQACQTPPTNIELSILDATPSDKQVILKWQTETEVDNAGFNVWRADGFVKINDAIIPALGSPTVGSEYNFVDEWVLNGKRYFYLLEDIDTNGISTFHGPVKAVPRLIYGVGK